MRIMGALVVTLLLLTACGSRDDEALAEGGDGRSVANGAASKAEAPTTHTTVAADSAATPVEGRADEPDLQGSVDGSGAVSAPGDAIATEPAKPLASGAAACMMQGGERLRVTPMRAVGTEPFWGARIEGRCVTYSHPEDQSGTRIWTQFKPARSGGTWSGAYGGRRFELRVRAEPGCSDDMSDKRYPLAAELTVNNEQRRGCAEPL